MKRILLVAGPVLCAFLMLAGLWFNFTAPRVGIKLKWVEPNWTVSEPSGLLRPGDKIADFAQRPATFETLLMDNAFLTSSSEIKGWLQTRQEVFRSLHDAVEVKIVADRSGKTVEATLPVTHQGWEFLRNPASAHILVSLVFLVVGWHTYRSTPVEPRALWFYLLCLSMSLVYLTNACCLWAEFALEPRFLLLLTILNYCNFGLAPALLLHFSLLMPRDRARPWLLFLIYGSAFFAILAFQVALQGALVALFFLCSLIAVAQGAWSYRGLLERQQMKWIGVGFLLGLGPWVVFNGLPLVVLGHRLISDTLPGACLVFIPIFMAVAVQRYRLFDVGSFLESTAVYLSSVALLVGLDFLVLSLLEPQAALGKQMVISLALLIGAYGPVRAALTRAFSRLTHRESLSLSELERLVDDFLIGAPAEEVAERLRGVVHAYLAPNSLELLNDCQLPTGAHLQVNEEATVTLVIAPGQALRCGALPGGRVYSSEVMARLDEIVRRATLYYQVSYHAGTADRERRQRLEERERLLGDLHDGVGSALSNIRLVSTDHRVSRLAGDALFELQNFLYTGPGYTISAEDFSAELRTYLNAAGGDEGPHIHLRVTAQQPLERSTALSLFRLIKEAMANCLKHAEAQNFWVSLEETKDDANPELTLVVRDDGKGDHGQEGRGRGLESMRSRIREMGGRLSIESNDGWQVRAKIPLGGKN